MQTPINKKQTNTVLCNAINLQEFSSKICIVLQDKIDSLKSANLDSLSGNLKVCLDFLFRLTDNWEVITRQWLAQAVPGLKQLPSHSIVPSTSTDTSPQGASTHHNATLSKVFSLSSISAFYQLEDIQMKLSSNTYTVLSWKQVINQRFRKNREFRVIRWSFSVVKPFPKLKIYFEKYFGSKVYNTRFQIISKSRCAIACELQMRWGELLSAFSGKWLAASAHCLWLVQQPEVLRMLVLVVVPGTGTQTIHTILSIFLIKL